MPRSNVAEAAVPGLQVRFGRRYNFTAAHRLHSDVLGAERSRVIYGKCNNPAGHGHNYAVTVVVEGVPHPVTGMVINMADLDRVARTILDEFGYHHLDLEVPEFKNRPSTAEHIAATLYAKFTRQLTGHSVVVRRLEISETRNNSCCLMLAGQVE